MTNASILSILAHATPTPTSRSKRQKSKSRGGGILWRPPSRTACFICCVCIFLFGVIYLGECDADVKVCRMVQLQSQNELLPFWWRYLSGSPNAGSRKGLGWIIFGLSDTDFCRLTANISKTVSRRVTYYWTTQFTAQTATLATHQ